MKKFVICLLGALLIACGKGQTTELIHDRPQIPAHIFLHDSDGNKVGMAVLVQDRIFVTADHLKEKYDKLFWKESPIHIIARDFENNLLFFELESWVLDPPVWSDSPPVLGEKIFWVDETSSLESENVRSISENIEEDSLYNERIVISGIAELPNSGSPIFGERGQVFGILVGADRSQGFSYAVRSDKILKILKENLE